MKIMKKIHICLSTDDNYVKYALTVMHSIMKNKAWDDEPIFHLLYSELNEENFEKLKSIDNLILHEIDNSIFSSHFNNGVCKGVTIPTLYRLKLPSLLPDVKRVLYLDCDVIVLKSLSDFYNTTLDKNQYAAVVQDFGSLGHLKRLGLDSSEGNFYFNAGVCLFNLEKMREDNIEQKMFDFLYKNWEHLDFSDQDVLNSVLFKNVKKMDGRYNFLTPNVYFANDKDATIVHFAGIKPWKIGFYNKYREMFWHYLNETGYNEENSKRNMIFFIHKRPMQILWFIKMYPLFFTKKERIKDFLRILINLPY